MKEKRIKDFISIIPLIGGLTIAAENVLGKKPKKVYSYPGFQYNDNFYLEYKKLKNENIDYEIIDLNKKDYKIEKADLVVALPPCAGLSNENNSKNFERKKQLNSHMIQVIKDGIKADAKLIIFENAPRLFSKNETEVKEQINKVVIENGYSITYYFTNSLLHGIPQNRKRTYAIISKTSKSLDLDFFKRKYKPLKEYIKEKFEKDDNGIVYQNKDKYSREFSEIISMKDFIKQKLKEKNLLEIEKTKHTPIKFLDKITTKEELTKEFFKKYNKFIEKIENEIKDENKKQKLIENFDKRKETFLKNLKRYFDEGKKNLFFKFYITHKKDYTNTLLSSKASYESLLTNGYITLNEIVYLMDLPNDFLKLEKLNITVLTQNVPVKTSEDIIKLAINAYENEKYANANIYFINNEKKLKENRENKKLF